MKIFRIVYVAILATALSVVLGSCVKDEHLKELEMEYSQLITGKWFDFSPTSSMYAVFESDNSFYQIGYGNNGWRERIGTYQIKGDKLIREFEEDGKLTTSKDKIEVTAEKLIFKRDDAAGDRVHYRVKENFSIQGNYSYLNGIAKVEPAEGKTALQLPDGVTYKGSNTIPVESLKGEQMVLLMKLYFANATFRADGLLRQVIDGKTMIKQYTHNGNELSFNLNAGSSAYKVNATAFPDEDEDRLFIIIPKQKAWIGGMVSMLKQDNPELTLTDTQIAALEEEFLKTFKTFTVVVSLSKNLNYREETVDYTQAIVGKWFNFSPETSMFMSFQADGKRSIVGWDKAIGWLDVQGTYRVEGDKLVLVYANADGSTYEISNRVEIKDDKLIYVAGGNSANPNLGEYVNYRVQESFDITGKYKYLNSVARVEPEEGKTEFKLPAGITSQGKNSLPLLGTDGGGLMKAMQQFFAESMFTPNGKLRHTVDGTVLYDNYTLNGNNLEFSLNNSGYKLKATSFPDEDGDRLFVIIQNQEVLARSLVGLLEKENPGLKITEAQIAELEKEFKETYKTFTMAFSLSKTGEYNAAEDVDPYKDYPEFIVGKWFNFTPDASGYISFQADGNYSEIGYNRIFGWAESTGTYRLDGNKLINTMSNSKEYSNIVDVTKDKLTYKAGGNPNYPEQGELNFYRVKESFDIKGNYTYLNSVARVEAAAGKTALQLPDGLLFNGQNSIPVSAMHGERIIEVMKKFFADATFAADGKLNHTMEGVAMTKNYTLNGINLVFNLYEGSDKYKVNATSFPDEDGDRLFIIIPKQAAWLGGMVELVEKENTGVKLTEAQIAELEKEFMATFETFTVVLSLSKK